MGRRASKLMRRTSTHARTHVYTIAHSLTHTRCGLRAAWAVARDAGRGGGTHWDLGSKARRVRMVARQAGLVIGSQQPLRLSFREKNAPPFPFPFPPLARPSCLYSRSSDTAPSIDPRARARYLLCFAYLNIMLGFWLKMNFAADGWQWPLKVALTALTAALLGFAVLPPPPQNELPETKDGS